MNTEMVIEEKETHAYADRLVDVPDTQVAEAITKEAKQNEMIQSAVDAAKSIIDGSVDTNKYLENIKQLGLDTFMEEAKKAQKAKENLAKVNLAIVESAYNVIQFLQHKDDKPDGIEKIEDCFTVVTDLKDTINEYFVSTSKEENHTPFDDFNNAFSTIIDTINAPHTEKDENDICEKMLNVINNHNNKVAEMTVDTIDLTKLMSSPKGLAFDNVLYGYKIISDKRRINEYAKKFEKFFLKKSEKSWSAVLGKRNKYDIITMAFYKSATQGTIDVSGETNTDILRMSQIAAYVVTNYVMCMFNDNTLSKRKRTNLLYGLFMLDNPEANLSRSIIMEKVSDMLNHIFVKYKKDNGLVGVEEAGEEINDTSFAGIENKK